MESFHWEHNGNAKEIRRAKRAGGILGSVHGKYKGNAKKIRRAKRAGEAFGVISLGIQRKCKGNPAREARRGNFDGIDKLDAMYLARRLGDEMGRSA